MSLNAIEYTPATLQCIQSQLLQYTRSGHLSWHAGVGGLFRPPSRVPVLPLASSGVLQLQGSSTGGHTSNPASQPTQSACRVQHLGPTPSGPSLSTGKACHDNEDSDTTISGQVSFLVARVGVRVLRQMTDTKHTPPPFSFAALLPARKQRETLPGGCIQSNLKVPFTLDAHC